MLTKLFYRIVVPFMLLFYTKKMAEAIMEYHYTKAEFTYNSKRRAELFLIAETMERHLR